MPNITPMPLDGNQLTADPKKLERVVSALQDLKVVIESTFSILNKDSKLVPLIFNVVQQDYWPKITSRDIVLKARKMGFTTVRVARLVAKCALMPYRRCIVVSHEEDATKRILGRAVEIIKNCAVGLDAKITETTITFNKTQSTLYIGTAGSKAFGRGDDITDYLLSEFAWWEKPDLITGIEEACVKDSEGCIESTAHGYGNPFHTLWLRAQRHEQGMMLPDGSPRFYTPHFFPWWQDPTLEVDCPGKLELADDSEVILRRDFGLSDRKILWRRMKRDAMFDPLLFPQEYPATAEESFLCSGSMVFDAFALQKHYQLATSPVWKGEIKDKGDTIGLDPSKRGRFTVWRSPKLGDKFIITADIAAGVAEGCFSVADVFDTANNEQVAQWHGRLAPELFGDVLCLMGAYFNYALLIPEVNNHGLTTCNRIRDNEYPNLYRRGRAIGGTDMGWYTSPGRQGTRLELINAAREAVRDYGFKLNSLQSISECRTFVTKENGDMDHLPGCFSDCVITAGIAAVMMKRAQYSPEIEELGIRARITGKGRHGARVSVPRFKSKYA